MANWMARGAPAAVVLAGMSSTASADVTPADVWENWQELGASMGQLVTAESETLNGGDLVLSGVQSEIQIDGGTIVTAIGQVTLSDQGDGTVAVSVPEAYAMAVDGTGPEGDTFTAEIAITQSNFVTIASGTPDAISYAYSADMLEVAMDEVLADGEVMQTGLRINLAGMDGTYDIDAATSGFASAGRADSMTVSAAILEPDGGSGNFTMNVSLRDLNTETAGTAGEQASNPGADLATMVMAGFATNGFFNHGAASYDISFVDGRDQFAMDATANSGAINFDISADGLSYGGGANGMDVTVSGSEIPLPQVSFQAGEYYSEINFPILPSDEETSFGFVQRIIDFTTEEAIWGMIDPSGALPRDPASIVLDLSGTGMLTTNIFGGEPAFGPPGEISSVSLNELLVSAIGAQITGSGAFDVDMFAPGPVPGMPNATGAIDLQIDGANALIDNLVNLGLLPQDQAMGARMMMGLFARPGDGPDSLVSKIEITEDGQILANGQRIQ